MAEIELNLDPFFRIRETLRVDLINPASLVPMAQLAGIHQFGVTIGERGSAGLEDLEAIRNITDARLTIRTPPDLEIMGNVLSYEPYLVILTHPTSIHGCLDIEEKDEDLSETIGTILDDESAAVGVRIKPELEDLKKAYKYGIDFVEFECSEFSEESSALPKKRFREKLLGLIRLCYKHDIEVCLSGKFDYLAVREFNQVEQVGIISVGRSVAAKSLLLGIREAINDLLT